MKKLEQILRDKQRAELIKEEHMVIVNDMNAIIKQCEEELMQIRQVYINRLNLIQEHLKS